MRFAYCSPMHPGCAITLPVITSLPHTYIVAEKIDCLQIGYEELCLSAKPVIKKVCDFLGIDVQTSMFRLENSKNHILIGNRMRNNPEKLEIKYDN